MNSMSAMFYILAFLLYAKARLAEEKREKWALFVGCSVAGMLALGSKEIAATLPVLIFLYDWYFFQNLSSSWLKRHLVYAMSTFILLGLILFFYLGRNPFNFILSTYAYRDFTLIERLLTQFRVVVYYITLLAYPHPSRLNLDHDFQLSHSLIDPMTTLLSMGSIVSLIGLALLIAKKDRLLSFCILWFLGNLLIESSVLGLEIMFEHRTYLPSMFVTFMAVVLAYRHIRLEGARILVLCGVIMVCSLWTYQRNGVWGDDVALGRDCVEKSPNKARPHVSLGWALYKKGKVDEAISHYKKALSIEPEFPKVHTNLGLALAEQGDYDGAIVHYQQAIRSNPGDAEAHTSLGLALSEKGRFEKAFMHYKKALQISPDFDRAHIALGITLAKQGKLDVAIAHFFQTLAISPHLEEAHYNIGIAFAKKGQLEEAIAHYSKALRIKPNNADAHNNLGIILARQGRFNDAISHFSQALQIKPDFSGAQNNLKRVRQLSRERE
jgi:Flp pilus assembly protein TadD